MNSRGPLIVSHADNYNQGIDLIYNKLLCQNRNEKFTPGKSFINCSHVFMYSPKHITYIFANI